MRPLKLVMTAFGPYADRVLLPMEQLGERGVYLITGDTGAGKTTIFDGITYALYGETSGGNRDGEMMRSTYADPATPTEVELEFLYRGEVYRIRRRPAYQRAKQRGEGTTSQPAVAEMVMPDGRVLTKAAEVTKEVTRLLGIDRSQFTQIAMIAQGDFLKLLLADTKDRIRIFRHIFKTENYSKLQERLKAETRALEQRAEETRRERRLRVEALEAPVPESTAAQKTGSLSRRLAEMKAAEAEGGWPVAEVLALGDELLEADREGKTRCDAALETVRESVRLVSDALTRQEEREKTRKLLERDRAALEMQEEAVSKAEIRVQEANDEASAAAGLQDAAVRLETGLADYDAAARIQEEIRQMEADASRMRADEERAKAGLTSLQNRQEELSLQLETLQTEEVSLAQLKADESLEKVEIERVSGVTSSINDLSSLCSQVRKAQEGYTSAMEQSESAAQDYARLRRAFLDGQAGILAAELIPGQACPVCGSVDHPAPASAAGEAPYREELEAAEKAAGEAAAKASAASEKAAGLLSRAQGMAEDIAKTGGSLIEGFASDDSSAGTAAGTVDAIVSAIGRWKSAAEAAASDAEAKLQKLQEAIRAEEIRLEKVGKIERELPQLREKIDAETQSLNEIAVQLSSAQAALDEKRKAEAAAAEKLTYPSKADAQREIDRLRMEAEQLLERKAQAAKLLESLRAEADGLKGQIRNGEALLAEADASEQTEELMRLLGADAKDDDPTQLAGADARSDASASLLGADPQKVTGALRDRLDILQDEEKSAAADLRTIELRLRSNEKNLSAIRDRREEAAELLDRFTWMKSLSDTVGGTLAGESKVMLETYVQMQYFDRIIERANTRLLTMTAGRYRLKRRRSDDSRRGQKGLELNVIDYHNGSERDIRTLSGGESFDASLALALGLSDEVQSRAGGIQLDTMFVDEGFGSLDSETLNRAMEALQGLGDSNRLVGIISHVAEMKTRIDRQIVVTRRSDGTSVPRIEV